ncbi:MAG: glycoside hydrolase family 19 protein [Patescibacteria group bacterium]
MQASAEERAAAIELILAECERQGITLKTQQAYVLATVEHETAGTWQPVKEAFWKDESWRQKNFRYFPFYGRGYVQLTHGYNYRKFSKIVGVNLEAEPNLVMEPALSAFILVYGFKHGTFTGKKIEDFIDEKNCDFIRARRCINGNDCARRIAKLADKHLSDLEG